MPTVFVEFHFQDGNGKEAQLRLHCPFRTAAQVEVFALDLGAALSAVSDATLTKVQQVWRSTDIQPGEAGPASDVRTGVLLFYRNGNATSSLSVPSPTGMLFETTGPYAGIRVTRDRLNLLGLLNTVEGLSSGLIDPVGRAIGPDFIVGGKVQR